MCPITKPTKTLAEALVLARQAAAEAKNQQAVAEKLKEEVIRLRTELDAAEEQSARAEKRQEDWLKQWAAAIAPLGLGESSVSIETVQDYQRAVAEMQQHLVDMRINAAHVKEIEEERRLLLLRVTALRQRLESAARLTTADTLDVDFREVDATLESARTAAPGPRNLPSSSREQERAHCNQRKTPRGRGSCSRPGGPGRRPEHRRHPACRATGQRAALAERQVHEQENALAHNTRGQPLDAFIVAALEHRDGLDAEIDALDSRLKQLDPDIADAEAESLRAEEILDEYRLASTAAAEAKQQAELIASRLDELVVEYAACHIAKVALDRAKERYRARHQASLLDRAGDFFQILTDHAFEGLDIENEEGTDVLKAVRAGGDSTRAFPSMDSLTARAISSFWPFASRESSNTSSTGSRCH